MGAFNQKRVLEYKPDDLQSVVNELKDHFIKEKFEVDSQSLISGGFDVSITKSDIFKNISGMQSALKIKIQPEYDKTQVDISVGIWGQQLIPTVISMFVFWPILLTQIWGLIRQSKLDDEALQVIESSLKKHCRETKTVSENCIFCPTCGRSYPAGTKFCSEDGTPLT